MADNYFGNLARATLGQGLGMEWGDEIEAGIRTLSGPETHEEELNTIRKSYDQFTKENPKTAMAAELAGAFIPTVASMFIPPLAPVAIAKNVSTLNKFKNLPQKLQKYGQENPIKTGMGTGAAVGFTAGAGGANEGERLQGGALGAGLGTVVGGVTQPVINVGGAAVRGVKNFLNPPSDEVAKKKATEVISNQFTPGEAEAGLRQMQQDQIDGVPSIMADFNPATTEKLRQLKQANLSDNSKVIDETIGNRNIEAPERVIEKLNQTTGSTNYYTRLDDVTNDLKIEAAPLYDEAYAVGEINDPQVLEIIRTNPSFRLAYQKAKDMIKNDYDEDILNGGDGSAFIFPDLDAGQLPTVKLLDKIKQGIDAVLEPKVGEGALDSQTKMGLRRVKNAFLRRIDEATINPKTGLSSYGQARAIYSSGAANREALEDGKDTFLKLAPEQIRAMLNGMNKSERAGFRVGAIRSMIDKINTPISSGSGKTNPTKQVTLGSRNTRANVKELFPDITDGGFDLFDAVLKRENQIYNNTVRILNEGSSTASNIRGGLELAEETGAIDASIIDQSLSRTLIKYVANIISVGSVSSNVQRQMAKMLLDDDPIKVAASVEAMKRASIQSTARDATKGVRNITNPFATTVISEQRGALGTSSAPTEEDLAEEARRRKLAFSLMPDSLEDVYNRNMNQKVFGGDGNTPPIMLPLDQQQ
tara:strand:- start:1278 stop:3383 length:2106 start_codon:yes stop_codon:yes gene_type:complete